MSITSSPSAFAVGTGRSGTHLLQRLLAAEPGVLSLHESDPINESFHRYCKWNELPVDDAGFLEIKRREIERALASGKYFFEASAYLCFSVETLHKAFASRFILLTRDPVEVVNSLWVKGWYETDYDKQARDLAVGYHAVGEPHHFFGRIVPRGGEFARWKSLTRIGKLAWFWNVTHARVLEQFQRIPSDSRVVRLEELDFEEYRELTGFLGFSTALSPGQFEAICGERPGAGREKKSLSSWSREELEQFFGEVGPTASALGYHEDWRALWDGKRGSFSLGPRERRNGAELDKLFVLAVKNRLINNTPYDVYKVLSSLSQQSTTCVDLRFVSECEDLPRAREAYLFLETTGTWMCFDWDAVRFGSAVSRVRDAAQRLIVVGPQARALRDVLGMDFATIDDLAFEDRLAPGHWRRTLLQPKWARAGLEPRYNGEFYDGERFRLTTTFSVYYSMNCPLTCDFCFYSSRLPQKRLPFEAVLGDMEVVCRQGCTHFYFMDPNFLLNEKRRAQVLLFQERVGGGATYCCQVSPNFLDEARLAGLRGTGCRAIVIGVENEELIAAKGTLAEVEELLPRIEEQGMTPVLFFLIDGKNEVRGLAEKFQGYPFRFSILNRAFAGNGSLQAIQAAFDEKRRLMDANRSVIEELQAAPGFLVNWTGQPTACAMSP